MATADGDRAGHTEPLLIVATPTSRHLRPAAGALEAARTASADVDCRAWVTGIDGVDVAAFEAGSEAPHRDRRRADRPPPLARPAAGSDPPETNYG